MTSEEVQDYLRISRSTLNLLCREEHFPYLRLKRKRLFRKEDVDRYMEKRVIRPEPPKKRAPRR